MKRAIESLKNLVVNPDIFHVENTDDFDIGRTEFRLLIPDINKNIKVIRKVTEVLNIVMAKRIENKIVTDYYIEGYDRVRKIKNSDSVKYYDIKGHTVFKTIREIEKDEFKELIKKSHTTVIKHIAAYKKIAEDFEVCFEYIIHGNRLHFSVELEVNDIHDGLSWLESFVDLLNLKSGDYHISSEPLIDLLYDINKK